MKILLSAYACEPNRGSESGNGWNWAMTLAGQGHKVWVLTRHIDDEVAQAERARRARHCPSLRIIELDVPRRAKFLKRGWPGVYIQYALWLRASLREAQTMHARERFDIAHHVTWGSLLWGCRLWRLGIPLVFGPVGGGQVTPAELRPYFKGKWWAEATRTFIVKRLLPFLPPARRTVQEAMLVLATNRDTFDLAERMGAKRVQLAIDTAMPPQFLDEGRRPLPADAAPLRLIWIGRLLPVKGLPLALESLRRVPRRVVWHLTIVGNGPQGKLLPGWINDLGLSDRVTWLGQIKWTAVETAYSEATAMLFTSLRDSFGAQLCEAMAHGLPVIALDHQGARDLLPDDAAIKVAIGDAGETADRLARAVTTLATDPVMRSRMSRAALDFARQSTWGSRVSEVYDEIERILARKPEATTK